MDKLALKERGEPRSLMDDDGKWRWIGREDGGLSRRPGRDGGKEVVDAGR